MIVVADTTPLNYLILIGEVDILMRLYGRVPVPESVRSELLHARTPTLVRSGLSMRRPGWRSGSRPLLQTVLSIGWGQGNGMRSFWRRNWTAIN